MHVLFGGNLVSLNELLGRPLANVPVEDGIHIVAIRIVKGRWMPPDANARINHFVIGTELAVPDPSPIGQNVVSLARRAGLGLKRTQASGDCGIDCLCFFDGESRDLASFSTMRHKLADLLETKFADESWREVFCMSAEHTACPAAVVSSSSSGGMGPPSGGGLLASGSPAASEPLQAFEDGIVGEQPASVGNALAASSSPGNALAASSSPNDGGAHVQPPAADGALTALSSHLPPALPPPPLPPPLDDELSEAMPPSSVVSGPGVHANFVEYLKCKPGTELSNAVVDYKSFMAAQAAWEERNPRRRIVKKTCIKQTTRSTTLKYRMATAVAYLEWRKGPGAGVKDHLKAWARC